MGGVRESGDRTEVFAVKISIQNGRVVAYGWDNVVSLIKTYIFFV